MELKASIRKAIIPAAGWGTRFLPATKAQPKEMLPLIDTPAIQYIVEEVRDSNIRDVLIVTGRTKRAIEDHFDYSVALETALQEKNNQPLLEVVRRVSNLLDIHYIRQKEQLGLGHAVYCAYQHVQNEPFAVLLSDDIILGETPCLQQLMDAYAQVGAAIVAVMEVAPDEVSRYGIVDPAEDPTQNLFAVKGLVEKPSPEQAPSNLAVIGRYILLPEIFSLLENAEPGANGEIQLTDALDVLAKRGQVYACRFSGTRYDIGEKLGYLQATVDMALTRADLADDFKRYLAMRLTDCG